MGKGKRGEELSYIVIVGFLLGLIGVTAPIICSREENRR